MVEAWLAGVDASVSGTHTHTHIIYGKTNSYISVHICRHNSASARNNYACDTLVVVECENITCKQELLLQT